VQFGGRAAVGGRIGRQGRRDSAEGLRGQAAGNGAARSPRASEVSRGRAGLAGADQCGVARGGGASGVTLASVEDGEDLDSLCDAVDQQVVWMDQRLAGSGQPFAAVDIGVIGQVLRRMLDCGVKPLRGREVTRADVVEYVQQIARRIVRPDERKRQRGLCLSRIDCAIAITSACGMLGASDVIARSTLARNHASYAAASSLVANSDSMGFRSVIY